MFTNRVLYFLERRTQQLLKMSAIWYVDEKTRLGKEKKDMDFYGMMKNGAIQRTENGAVGYVTSKSALVDLNFATGSMRNMSEDEIVDRFWNAWNEDQVLALRWLFFARDIRNGGMGERRTFRTILGDLIYNDVIPSDKYFSLYKLIEKYGRLDDFINLIDIVTGEQKEALVEVLSMGLAADTVAMLQKKPVTLLAKWMPSINTSSKETKARAAKLAQAFRITHREYRMMLSKLRAYIDVTEVRASANDWDKIDYSKVPSYANIRFANAFLKHDQERREKYLESLKKGETKINAGTLFPYDIVHKYGGRYPWSRISSVDDTLEQLWKALPDYELRNTLVVADGSGSMRTQVGGGSEVTALEVANSIAIYASEHNEGAFADKYITFSGHPEFVEFRRQDTLHKKLNKAYEYDECANTNIEAVFKLILHTAVHNNVPANEMPERILIISDMEFDDATHGGGWWGNGSWKAPDKALFEEIAEAYADRGYKLPKLVFWNVCSRTNTIPVQENELGVALVSGFSPAIFDMVMSDEVDPYKILVAKLEGYKDADKLLN